MKILLTGATGFVGSTLIPLLKSHNHELVILTRNVNKAKAKLGASFQYFTWDAEKEIPPQEAFANLDAVIHLAGEGIADKRWSKAQKNKIKNSRIQGTQNLVEGIDKFCKTPLQVFVSTSAIGFYGSSVAKAPLSETSPRDVGFLADVCESWETAALKLKNAKRKVIIRVGVVLGQGGGALQKMLPIFKLGLAGPLGNGKQGFSWIHQNDLARIYLASIENAQMQGIYNGVAPNPVSNAEFTKILAKTLHRPAFFPVPSFALKVALGEMSEMLLKSQYIVSTQLPKAGFEFQFPRLQEALEHICHKA